MAEDSPTWSVLDLETYREGLFTLSSGDPDLALILTRWGAPPFWIHEPGFAGLVISILAQQVSLESAAAVFKKLLQVIPRVTPERVLELDDETLKEAGFSRQKAAYVRGVAHALVAGDFDLNTLESMDNVLARESLIRLKGVGRWTADAYLLFSLRRADVWPSGDLALVKAIQEVKRLPVAPSSDEADTMAEDWTPWRGVAARMLWYHYLASRGRITSASFGIADGIEPGSASSNGSR